MYELVESCSTLYNQATSFWYARDHLPLTAIRPEEADMGSNELSEQVLR
jgi:hypothetical protein